MENLNKQHVELPSVEGVSDLTPQDQLVYLGIKSFMNKDTMEAYPSQQTVGRRIGCCDKTIRKCVQNLVDKNYITIRKEGKKIIYKFNKTKQFEPFSYEFLEDPDLSSTQKALLISTQQYMVDKESGIGKISYSKHELAEKINMPYPTLVKTSRELARKDIVSVVTLDEKDQLTGCKKQQMQFNFEKYGQAIVKTLINHEVRLEDTENAVVDLIRRVEALEAENKRLREQNILL